MSKKPRRSCLLVAAAYLLVATAAATSAEPTAAESPLANAQWIAPPAGANGRGPLPLLRKEFSIDGKIARATLRIVGLGDYDPRVNGTRLASTGINQPWSQYEKTIYYREFDLMPWVHPGANCLGVLLGNSFWHNPNAPAGRYNKPGPQREAKEPLLLCAEIIVEQQDGRNAASSPTPPGGLPRGPSSSRTSMAARISTPAAGSRIGPAPAWTTARGNRSASCRPRRRGWCARTGPRSRSCKALHRRRSKNRRRAFFSTASRRIARPSWPCN